MDKDNEQRAQELSAQLTWAIERIEGAANPQSQLSAKNAELIAAADLAKSYRAALVVVAEMRKAQRAYFKTRTQETLIAARRLETAVDMRLGELGVKAE